MLFVIVLAALVGLMGTSPLARKVVTQEECGARYEVEYAHITRYEHAERMHVRVRAPGAQGDTLTIAFSNDFVESGMVASSFPVSEGGGAPVELPIPSWVYP